MNRLKVLHVISQMDPKMGGVCQALRTIIPGLEKLEVHNEVVSLDSPDSSFISEEKFIIHSLGSANGAWQYNKRLLPWLLKNLAHYDCVILHGLWQYTGFALEKAIRLFKKANKNTAVPKVFVMPHGMLDPYFQKAKERKLKAIRNWIYWKLIEQHVVNRADGLLFTCQLELELAKLPFFPYKPKRQEVVGLGIEAPPEFTEAMATAFRQKCPEIKDDPYLLFLSRIHPKKGVDLLIKAYASIIQSEFSKTERSSFPKLVIAGPGLETSYGRTMQELASSLLPNEIYFPGMLTKDAKWGAFYGCECFVLPSHQENFGIAVAEALACSKPVIISNQVNIWREIAETGGGIIGDDTYEGTRHSLKTWLSYSDGKKVEMSRKARITFEKKFSIEINVTRLKEAIEVVNP